MRVESPAALSSIGGLRFGVPTWGGVSATSASAREVRSAASLRPLGAPRPSWVATVVLRTQELLGDRRWNYSPKAIFQLVTLLSDSMFYDAPEPFVSPLEDGGISAEFRTDDVEFHVAFDARGEGSVYAFQEPGLEFEGPLDELPDGLEKWAWRLAYGSY